MLTGISLCVLAAFSLGTPSQTETGKIIGTVTDPSGAIIAGASVRLKSVDTAAQRQAASDDSGNFIFPNLPPGVYEIKVEAPGFDTKVVRSHATVGSSVSVDISLEIGKSRNIVWQIT